MVRLKFKRASTEQDAISETVLTTPVTVTAHFPLGAENIIGLLSARQLQGGSFLCNPSYCESYRPSARRGTPSDTGSSHTGFRCVVSEAGWETDLSVKTSD